MKRYVSERIGDDYLNWQVGKNVLISTPTGSGKTTFVIEVLLRHAIRQGKHVVYYCNRRILNDQFSVISEERIKKMYSGSGDISAEEALSHLHIFTYQYMERLKTHPNVYYENENTGEKIKLQPDDILYYVFDEAHYCISDAIINANTNYWLDSSRRDKDKLKKSICVYLTATPEPLYLFLGQSDFFKAQLEENLYKAITTVFGNRQKLSEQINKFLAFMEKGIQTHISPGGRIKKEIKLPSKKDLQLALQDGADAPLQPWYNQLENIISARKNADYYYTDCSDYSHVKPVYFHKYEDLIQEIEASNSQKWLVFVDNEYQGKRFLEELINEGIEDVGFLSRNEIDHNEESKDVYDDIVTYESYECRILITTSVLDCGINICDPKVKNIVIACDNKTGFLQMLGRKRIEQGEELRLFIKAYNFHTIHQRLRYFNTLLKELVIFSLKNEIECMGNNLHYPSYSSIGDGNIYTAAITQTAQEKLGDTIADFRPIWYIQGSQRITIDSYYGHEIERMAKDQTNIERHFSEFRYSRTLLLYLLLQMKEYESAFKDYRQYSEAFNRLCEFAKEFMDNDEAIDRGDLRAWLMMDELKKERDELLGEYQKENIKKFSKDVEREDAFFLKTQLAWIEKEYDEKCWLNYVGVMNELNSYLKDLAESKKILDETEQEEFAEKCLSIILRLPVTPETLKKDASRYRIKGIDGRKKLPGKKKLNQCFQELKLPYEIVSKQRSVENQRHTFWIIVQREN